MYPGSIIAGASFAAALVGINWAAKGGWPLSRLLDFLGTTLHVERVNTFFEILLLNLVSEWRSTRTK